MTRKEIPYGFIEDNKLFRNGLNDGSPIELCDLIENNESESISSFEEKFKKVSGDFAELENRILGTDNKGSFLAKLKNLKDSLSDHEGLGDYDSIFQKLELYENQIIDIIQSNRKRNTEIKNALMLELEEAVKNNDLHEAGIAIKDIKSRWMKTGSADESVSDDLENRFKKLAQGFYEKRQSFYDDRRKLADARLEKYDNVLKELEAIITNEKPAQALDKVKELQERWKSIGHIAEAEFKKRNDRYWQYTKLFYDELKSDIKQSAARVDVKGNLELKKAVIDQLAELETNALYNNIKEGLDEAKKVWKSIGRVPKENLEEMNASFIRKLDSISERTFVFNLACRRNKGFAMRPQEEKGKILFRLVKELLSKDRNELDTFRGNMDNMNVQKGSFVDMLEKKLKDQEKRVEAKKQILDFLKGRQNKVEPKKQ